jgi:ribosomal protein S18 acetylase RimI-like enzyme
MLIRNAQEQDFMSCVSIARKAWPEFKERESIYHLFCKFFNNTCFVCERDGEIVGFVLGFISQVNPSQAYIHLVAVDPSAQRLGLAERLYQKFFNAAVALNAHEVRLIVNPDNSGSLAFHKKLGFQLALSGETIEIDGVLAVKDYNGPGLHMVPFSRSLP